MAVDPTNVGAVAQVTGAIQLASRATGAGFDYLLATARIESNLNPSAQAATSSAKGLFQFLDQTWLGTMKNSGAALGYGGYADAISMNASTGRYEVADPSMRSAIMQLRGDPSASAAMAGAFTRNNAAQLSASLGRQPSDGELYIAHFLGADGASKLINAATFQPNASAADLFPHAASANRAIFYDRAGNARATSDVYARLANKFDAARVANGSPPRAVPDTAGVTQAYAQAHQKQVIQNLAADDAPAVPDTRPLFQVMFSTRERQAVAPVVQALWQGGAGESAHSPGGAPRATGVMSSPAGVKPLELFQDVKPDVRSLFNGAA